jgi:hypothetical protein
MYASAVEVQSAKEIAAANVRIIKQPMLEILFKKHHQKFN